MSSFRIKRALSKSILLLLIAISLTYACTKREDGVNNSKTINPNHQHNMENNNSHQSIQAQHGIIDTAQTHQNLAEGQVFNSMSDIPSAVHDEQNKNVTIIFPSDYFVQADSSFDYQQYALDQDFISATPNPDNSVTVVMSQQRHNALLKSVQVEIENSAKNIMNDSLHSHIKKIDVSSDFHNIDIYVDSDKYDDITVHTAPFTLAASALIYQTYAGTERHVHVRICNYETNITLESFTYPQ